MDIEKLISNEKQNLFARLEDLYRQLHLQQIDDENSERVISKLSHLEFIDNQILEKIGTVSILQLMIALNNVLVQISKKDVNLNLAFSANYYSNEKKYRVALIKKGYSNKTNDSDGLETFIFENSSDINLPGEGSNKNQHQYKKGEGDIDNILQKIETDLSGSLVLDHSYIKALELFYHLRQYSKTKSSKGIFSMLNYFQNASRNKNVLKININDNNLLKNHTSFSKYLEVDKSQEFNTYYYYSYFKILFSPPKESGVDMETYLARLLVEIFKGINNSQEASDAEAFWRLKKTQFFLFEWWKNFIPINAIGLSANNFLTNESKGNIIIFSNIPIEEIIEETNAKKVLGKIRDFCSSTFNSIYEVEARIKRKIREQKVKEFSLKSGIISIIVDSFAHNIGAHSLAALKWISQKRYDNLKEKIFSVKEEKDDSGTTLSILSLKSDKKGNEIRLENQAILASAKKMLNIMPAVGLESDEVSLLDIFHFSNDKNFSLTLKKIIETNGEEIIKRIPLSIDNALYKYFTYLRDKSAFWGGVTRDVIFGGNTISWYELLWNGFATNPLFLGTITHSEGINKLNLYVKVINNRNNQEYDEKENDFLRLVQIDCSTFLKELMYDKNSRNQAYSKKDYFDDINYSKYAFIRINEEHELLSKKLESLPKVFLPNGVIGKHALFTIIENTIRNIKHKINSENNIEENGIDLYLTIEEKIIDNYHINGSPVLFQVGLWLNYFENQARNKNYGLYEAFHEKLIQNVIDPVSYQPNFGGNSQDKICAAMLLNNTFISINQDLSSNRKVFFPYILPSIIFKEQTENKVQPQNEYSYYDHILSCGNYNDVDRN